MRDAPSVGQTHFPNVHHDLPDRARIVVSERAPACSALLPPRVVSACLLDQVTVTLDLALRLQFARTMQGRDEAREQAGSRGLRRSDLDVCGLTANIGDCCHGDPPFGCQIHSVPNRSDWWEKTNTSLTRAPRSSSARSHGATGTCDLVRQPAAKTHRAGDGSVRMCADSCEGRCTDIADVITVDVCRGDPCGRPMSRDRHRRRLGDHKGRPYALSGHMRPMTSFVALSTMR